MQQVQQRPCEVVCLAAPEDALLLAQWEEQLLPLQEEGYFTCWSERHLTDGAARQEELSEHLHRADLIVFLVSPHFFAANECLVLLEQALHRHTAEEALALVLLLQPADTQDTALASLPCLPSHEPPIAQWDDPQAAFKACAQELLQLKKLPPGGEITLEEQNAADLPPEVEHEKVLIPTASDAQSQPEIELAASTLAAQQPEEHIFIPRENFSPRETRSWSWKRALVSLPASLLIGLTAGLVTVLLYGVVAWLSNGPVMGLFYALFVSMPDALPIALLTGLLGALLGSALYGFSGTQPAKDPTDYAIEEHEESII